MIGWRRAKVKARRNEDKRKARREGGAIAGVVLSYRRRSKLAPYTSAESAVIQKLVGQSV